MSEPVGFNIDEESEVILHLEMSSNTNWAIAGMESAVLTIFVDSNYDERNQDIVLFNGDQLFVYKVSLGRLSAGDHTLEFYFDEGKSSLNATNIHIERWDIIPITPDNEYYDVYRLSPILYGRDDNYYTDTPLLLWHEVQYEGQDKWIQYSIIWSNEDGGTNSINLMSRWGRTTDIEWIYWVKIDSGGNILENYFQGPGHSTSPFLGIRANDHPILKTVTLNNMVSDVGISDYKFFLSPERSKGEDYSRETLMDNDPWTYKIMAEEMINEGKYESPADPFTVEVSDARNYLYLEFNSLMEGSDLRLTFGVKLKDNSIWYYSVHNDPAVQAVNGEGWRRTTIELPEGTPINDLDSLKIMGSSYWIFTIILEDLSKIFMLNDDYTLLEYPLLWGGEVVLNEYNSTVLFAFDELTAIAGNQVTLRSQVFFLSQNYPNPFNTLTSIQYELPNPLGVTLKIYSTRGQEVKTLVDQYQGPGFYTAHWDGRNDEGSVVSSGLYFCRITAGEFTQTKKMILIR
ncbi:T9SS type A sorting domain-containing protein [candidate division KSB1 bacterium]|nr:T9SS type A sorting domain-containing protein [candidate division KSB1 bacterium]